MFTGIIEQMGTLASLRREADGAVLEVRCPGLRLALGESVAVDGACLTAIRPAPGRLRAVLSGETLRRTRLGTARPGDLVNLERSLRAGERMGGHFVLGHVDARGEVEELRREEPGAWLVVRFPDGYDRYIVEKGSVAVNGVSLTVADSGPGRFEIALIPHTLEATNLGRLRRGSSVNLEFDYLAKLVVGLMESRMPPAVRPRRSPGTRRT